MTAEMFLSEGRYKLEKLVASGQTSIVYRAIDTRFNRPCAIKEMHVEIQNEAEHTRAVERFWHEATLLLDLNHPCIPHVRDFFVENGKYYLVMDFIDGRTLADVLDKEGNVVGLNGARGVSEARARSWGQQICNVLSYLHHLNPPLIYRDLKPVNIMLTMRDEIKLTDFGTARIFQSQQQATTIMTIGYAPPEQLLGRSEPRSDIYALGATLYRVLTHYDAAKNKPGIFDFPPLRSLRPDVSPAFEAVIMKALAQDLQKRWHDAEEMERAIINLSSFEVNQIQPFQTSVIPVPSAQASNAPIRIETGTLAPSTTDSVSKIYSVQGQAPSATSVQEPLQFTAFYPRAISTGIWNTLLVYAYIETALQAIRADAARFTEELGQTPSEVDAWASHPLTRGIPLRVIPSFQGVYFNPERIEFSWIEDWHSAKFRFQADKRLAGTIANGEVAIYADLLLVGVLKLSLRLMEPGRQSPAIEKKNLAQVSSSAYRKIFASYSHTDTPVVNAIRTVAKALGDETLIDIENLRSGEDWNPGLLRLIDKADIFQLFWSDHSAQSRYVEQEWRYAFKHAKGQSFIRPVYWKKPMYPPPAELAHIHFQYIELPQIESANQALMTEESQRGQSYISGALAHLSAGRIEDAFADIQQAYRLEPNNSLVHRIFGQVFAHRQPPMIESALQAYTTSLQLNPGDAETHKLIGDVWLFLRRQPAQAISEYTQSLRLNPNDVESHQRLGQCYEEINQLEAALREYQEATRLAGKQAGLFYKVGQLATRLNRFPVAEHAYVQILLLDAADYQARFLLSQVYESEGKLEDAWRECNYVLGPMANNPAAQAMFQRLRLKLRR